MAFRRHKHRKHKASSTVLQALDAAIPNGNTVTVTAPTDPDTPAPDATKDDKPKSHFYRNIFISLILVALIGMIIYQTSANNVPAPPKNTTAPANDPASGSSGAPKGKTEQKVVNSLEAQVWAFMGIFIFILVAAIAYIVYGIKTFKLFEDITEEVLERVHGIDPFDSRQDAFDRALELGGNHTVRETPRGRFQIFKIAE